MNELEGRWSILVVDERREREEAFRAHLEKEGYAVVAVDNEEAAYDAFLREPFDTVLARLSGAPEGQTLLERLNKLAPEVPFIVVEAEGSDADAAMQRGAFGIVHHPPSLKEIRRVLMHARVYRGLEQQRRRALEEARAYKKFYEDVLRSVSDGLLVFDSRGKLRFQNARVDEILGQEAFEDEEVDPEATNLHKNLISQILQLVASTLTEGVEERRMLVFKGESRSMYLEVMTSRLRGSDGSIQGAIAALRDRSEERLLEEQLMHTERLATLGGLLAAIAHDIHNPLGAITGCAEIGLEAARETEEAAEGLEPGPAREALEQAARDMKELFDQVHDAGLRCRTIADNLLAYSRRSPARRQRVNLNEVLKDTVQFVSRYRKLGEVEVVYRLEPGLADAAVDGAEVQQAFTNIIDNAIQAMADCETQRLELTSRSEGGKVIIEIADTGPGIPSKRLKRIWQPFFTTKGSGTGLGLHITKRVIENQNGKISVSSEVGRGTAFTIELPLV